MDKSKSRLDDQDWRLQAVTTLAKDFKSPWTGTLHKAGAIVTLSTNITYKKNVLSMLMPSMISLFLEHSHNLWDASQQIVDDPSFLINTNGRFIIKDDDANFRFFEKRMGAIIFSITALEAFANEYIPEDFSIHSSKFGECKNWKEHKTLLKEDVERIATLETKLDSILPEVMSTPSPKGSARWESFKQIKRIRDRIIHLKSKDRKSSGVPNETIWQYLFSEIVYNPADTVKDFIESYFQSRKPRWLEKYPY